VSFAGAVAWTAVAKWAGQAVSWASTIVVARLLAPQDYGLVAMATIYLGLVAIINEFGLGMGVVTNRELDDHQIAQLNTIGVAVGVVALAVSCLVAVPLGVFFRAPDLPAVVVVTSTAFPITSLRTIPVGLLQKDLRFRRLATAESAQTLTVAVSTVVLALLEWSYWALVFGQVLGHLAFTSVVLATVRSRFARPRVSSIRSVLTFSRQILVGRLAWYVQSTADLAVAGRVLGGVALGVYSMALTLSSLLLEKVSALVNQVSLPFFAASRGNPADMRRLVLTLTEGLALVAFPVSCGLALVAPEFVPLVLGERWLAVIPPLQVLAGLTAYQALVTVLPPVVLVTGGARLSMYLGLSTAVVMPIAFYIGSGWGTTGIAMTLVLFYPILNVPLFVRTFRRTELSPVVYLGAVWPALSAALAMAAAVLALKAVLPPTWPLAARFTAEVLVGAATYLGLVGTVYRARVVAFYHAFCALESRTEGRAPLQGSVHTGSAVESIPRPAPAVGRSGGPA
jgi:PST family polysaccharide transporter